MPHDKIVNLTLISQKFKNIGICHFSLALSQITLKQRNFQKTQTNTKNQTLHLNEKGDVQHL